MSELASEEDRLWDESKEATLAIRRRGVLFNDVAYAKRLNELMTALYPEFEGAITVRVVNDVTPNAFAFPNGDVYFSLGLLARLENEAQIAMVLGHEGAHFVQRHSYRGRQSRLVAGTIAGVIGIAGGAVGGGAMLGALGGQIVVLGGAAGHGRDLEREADAIGFARAQKIGVGKRDAVRAFEVLRDFVKHSDQPAGPFLFASHPKLEERIESLSGRDGKEETTMSPTTEFAALHKSLRLAWLPLEISAGRYRAMVAALEDEKIRQSMPPEALLYLSEAYRLRGLSGDTELADKQLDEAAKLVVNYAPVSRALGLRAMRWGHRDDALMRFNEYLERAPRASDRAFIESYIKQLQEEGKKP
jgi:beta-barrel assembly-enhancing protease